MVVMALIVQVYLPEEDSIAPVHETARVPEGRAQDLNHISSLSASRFAHALDF